MKDRSLLGQELYNPESYEPEELPLKIEQHNIPESEVVEWGKLTTCLRAELKAKVDSLREVEQDSQDQSEDEAHGHKVIARRATSR